MPQVKRTGHTAFAPVLKSEDVNIFRILLQNEFLRKRALKRVTVSFFHTEIGKGTEKKYNLLLMATHDAETDSCTITDLEKATFYKFNIAAYAEDGTLLQKSVLVRATTEGGKYTNASKLVLETKKKLTLGIGDTKKVKAELEYDDRNLKFYVNKAFGKIFRLESSDRKVAKVKNGKIIAVGKGTCKIYVYAQNGEWDVIKVTVK